MKFCRLCENLKIGELSLYMAGTLLLQSFCRDCLDNGRATRYLLDKLDQEGENLIEQKVTMSVDIE